MTSLLLLEGLKAIWMPAPSRRAPLLTTSRLPAPDWPTNTAPDKKLLQTEPAPVTSATLLLPDVPPPTTTPFVTASAPLLTTNMFAAPLLPTKRLEVISQLVPASVSQVEFEFAPLFF